MSDEPMPAPVDKHRVGFSVDYRIIIFVLVAVIASMVIIWKPWQKSANLEDRTVSVTGQATITAEPDEFIFSPTYEFKDADKANALKEVTKKSDEVVAKLKNLGIKDNKIKTNSGGIDSPIYYQQEAGNAVYTLSLTVTTSTREEAQKVQDYLLTTSPTGPVSPATNFSDAKRKTLESQARDSATKEARAKADQSAKNLGFKVGAVKSVDDGAGFNEPSMNVLDGDLKSPPMQSTTKLAVQPGENELKYSVTVTYFVR